MTVSSDKDCLWTPTQIDKDTAEVTQFANHVSKEVAFDWHGDFQALWQWSVHNSPAFWNAIWDWHGVIGKKGTNNLEDVLKHPEQMPGAQFFPEGEICFAENMLRDDDDRPAISAHGEDGRHVTLTRRVLKQKVMALAGWLRIKNVGPGDRVAAYVANIPEAIIMMLATSSVGAVFSSCSPDFGIGGVRDRFSQIEPKILMAVDGYLYAGKKIDRMPVIRELVASMPTVKSVLIVPYLDDEPTVADLPDATLFDIALSNEPIADFVRVKFNDPLYILFSSGTTGAPKCIVHGAGGVTLQHIKELRLHSNVRDGDSLFYFTTCGWMMWNWLVSGLMVGAKIVLYEGSPFYPGPERLWNIAEAEKLSQFGTSAKYIDAVKNAGYHPKDHVDLSKLRTLLSTGSPLSSDGFKFVYDEIKGDIQLCSISGGTDIVSCFVLGCPVQPVYAGEIQTRGLGMAVDVLGEDGKPVRNQQGELCCMAPFPSMPVKFWNDPDGALYRAAYFENFTGVWRHGDWATLNDRGGLVIHGRSDATLNPGGVRIGTAEIYRQVEAFDQVAEALIIGQNWQDDVRVVLFVRMAEEQTLTEALISEIKTAIRSGATPRHVPAFVIAVPDIPRTRSGKITELAVRDIIHGRTVKNTEALANAEALRHFENLAELQ